MRSSNHSPSSSETAEGSRMTSEMTRSPATKVSASPSASASVSASVSPSASVSLSASVSVSLSAEESALSLGEQARAKSRPRPMRGERMGIFLQAGRGDYTLERGRTNGQRPTFPCRRVVRQGSEGLRLRSAVECLQTSQLVGVAG